MTRDKAIEILEMFLYKQCSLSRTAFAYTDNEIWDAVNTATEALADKPTGKWVVVSDGYENGFATAHICECSICGDTVWVYKDVERRWNYCPNCGAKMEK